MSKRHVFLTGCVYARDREGLLWLKYSKTGDKVQSVVHGLAKHHRSKIVLFSFLIPSSKICVVVYVSYSVKVANFESKRLRLHDLSMTNHNQFTNNFLIFFKTIVMGYDGLTASSIRVALIVLDEMTDPVLTS